MVHLIYYAMIRMKGIMLTSKRNEHEITRNASQFKQIKLEPGTVVIDCDDNTAMDIPTSRGVDPVSKVEETGD